MSLDTKPAEHHIADAMRRLTKSVWRADDEGYIKSLIEQAIADLETAIDKIKQRQEET
jgi:hypothetical protein